MNTFKKPRWLIRESNVTNEDLYFNRREFIKKSSIYLGSSAIAYSYLSKYGTASQNNINIAKHHLKKSKLKINYLNCSPENLNISKRFDVILNMEIVEHVENIDNFIKQSSKFLKKNGIMFVATLNQTLKSYLFAIIGAEYVLRWLPIGTHEWEKFVKPENLINICQKNSLKLKKIDGMTFNPLFNQWKVSSDKSVNYITEFEKV